MGKLLTPKELGELLKLSIESLKRMRQSGEGPPFVRLSLQTVRYDSDDVDRWLATRRRGGQSGQQGTR